METGEGPFEGDAGVEQAVAAAGGDEQVLRKIRFIVCILRGLRHIHMMDLCHRDLKPANLFLSREGVVKLGDFGLAKSFAAPPLATPPLATPSPHSAAAVSSSHWASSPPLTTTPLPAPSPHSPQQQHTAGAVPPHLELGGGVGGGTRGVGTALYAAPEQSEGASVAASADIFSLGIIIVELFSSFGSGMERVVVLSRARQGLLPEPLEEQHSHIATLARKCLERVPELRPTAQELLESFCPMIERTSLPPLLAMADKTIAHLRQQLVTADIRERELRAVVEELRAQLQEREREIEERDARIEALTRTMDHVGAE
jgi:serine/threonine protein kinase